MPKSVLSSSIRAQTCVFFNQCPKAHLFCCSGEDVDKVGGAGADNNFMTLSDSSTCGKMTALAKLLDLWYQQESANKVRSPAPACLLIDWRTCSGLPPWEAPSMIAEKRTLFFPFLFFWLTCNTKVGAAWHKHDATCTFVQALGFQSLCTHDGRHTGTAAHRCHVFCLHAYIHAACKACKACIPVQVLVFSHSVRMLDIIERLVIMTGYVYLRLDGSTKQQDRQTQVDQFNNSACVFLFLISTTAGGLGLNLTSANRCEVFLVLDCNVIIPKTAAASLGLQHHP